MRSLLSALVSMATLSACTVTGQQSCPPNPVVVEGVAQANPCQGKADTFILKTYRARLPDGEMVTLPLRCGNADFGYTHIRMEGHGDPVGDPSFDRLIRTTLVAPTSVIQSGGNPRWTIEFNDLQASCFHGWGFRVVGSLAHAVGRRPLTDGQPLGVVTAYVQQAQPPSFP